TTANTTATSDTFDLGVSGQGDKGQNVTVEVTPADQFHTGSTANASAIVVNSPPLATNTNVTISHALAGINITLPFTDADDDIASSVMVAVPSSGNVTPGFSGNTPVAFYVPTGFVGTATFGFMINDGTALSNNATVTVELTNIAPSANVT